MRLKLAVLGPERRRTELADEGGRSLVRMPLDVDVVNEWHGWVDRLRVGYVIPWDADELPLTMASRVALQEGRGAQHVPVDLALTPFEVLHHPFAVWYPRLLDAGTLSAAVYLTDGNDVRWHRLRVDWQRRDASSAVVTTTLQEAEGRVPVTFVER